MSLASRTGRLYCILTLLASALPTTAQGADNDTNGGIGVLERMLQRAKSREQYLASVLAPLRRFDLNQNGLEEAELDVLDATSVAQSRAYGMKNILGFDLNWDGRVTRDEVRNAVIGMEIVSNRRSPGAELDDRVNKQVNRIMAADGNGDDIITIDEMRDYQARVNKDDGHSRTSLARSLLALDPNKDGRLTADELIKLATETFARYDTNGDEILSHEEVAVLSENIHRDMTVQAKAAKCDLPKAAANEQLAVLGIYGGEGLSTASVVGMDERTATGKVIIEPGDKPLYLVLITYNPMLWQIVGDTKRVSRAVAIGRTRDDRLGVGITGLSRDRITFLDANECKLSFDNTKSPRATQAAAIIERAVGRPVTTLAGIHNLFAMKMPSGTPVKAPPPERKAPAGVPQDIWTDFVQFFPGGLTSIDAGTVVSPEPAQPYDVLPAQAGIIQLIKTGAIERLGYGKLRIVKPIRRYPAGLHGGLSVTFVLGKGVPQPGGLPGHSCVLSEETGKPLSGSQNCGNR